MKQKSPMKKADLLFSKYVRLRDGTCQARWDGRECAGVLQCAHLISRSYKSIRTDPANAVALCQGHHTYYTHRPLEWREWIDDMYSGLWERLRTRALAYERVDWKTEVSHLESLLKEWE